MPTSSDITADIKHRAKKKELERVPFLSNVVLEKRVEARMTQMSNLGRLITGDLRYVKLLLKKSQPFICFLQKEPTWRERL